MTSHEYFLVLLQSTQAEEIRQISIGTFKRQYYCDEEISYFNGKIPLLDKLSFLFEFQE
jgi:hypothetical protein